MIKILEFANQWSMGGTEKTAQLVIEHLPRERYEVYAAGWRGGERLPAVERAAQETFIDPDPGEMTRWIRSRQIDIVHFHRMGVTDNTLIKTFVDGGVPILVEHNIFGHFDDSADREKITRHILLSRLQRELHARRGGDRYEPAKSVPIYMPVETAEWARYARPRDTSRPVFGRHSRAAAAKWHDINVECLPYIRQAIPNAEFHVIGLAREYREKIIEAGCMDMVREFPPALGTRELSDFLYGLNVFSHGSSLGESFGVAIAEAMATGLSVVTHSGGDATQEELISDGFNGYVTPPNNARMYADRVIELLRNPAKQQAFGSRSKARARLWFDVAIIIDKLDRLFTSLYREHRQ